MTCGVYKICANHENEIVLYVGQSMNIERRWTIHDNDFRKGCHDNRLLQQWNDMFGGVTYRRVTTCNQDELLECERNHIEAFAPLFNIQGAAEHPLFAQWMRQIEDGFWLFPTPNEQGNYSRFPNHILVHYRKAYERIVKAGFANINTPSSQVLFYLIEVLEKYGY